MSAPLTIEIISNQLEGGFSKPNHPEMAELIDSMRLLGMDVNLKKKSYSEKEEINIASKKFASGVKAKTTVTRETLADTHLTTLADMSRLFKNTNNRVLHLNFRSLTLPSGGLILAQFCHKQGIPVFITGLDKSWQTKLTFQVDPEFNNVPLELQGHDELQEEYRKRSGKKTLVGNITRALLNLPILPKKLQKKISIFINESKAPFEVFSEPEMINMMIASEYISRYQTIIDQFFQHLYEQEYSWSRLLNEFEFLLFGISFKILKDRFFHLVPKDYLLEIARNSEPDPSNHEKLLYYVRAYLKSLPHDHEDRRKFKSAFLGLFYFYRFQQDPELHHQLIFMETREAVETEFLQERKIFYKNFSSIAEQAGAKAEHEEIPAPIKEILFEELLKLFFLANFIEKRSGENLDRKEIMAREVLQAFQLFCMFMIDARKVKPTKNIKGLAKVYAQQHTVRWGEIPLLMRSLSQYISPLESTLLLLKEKVAETAQATQQASLNKTSQQYMTSALRVLPKLRFRVVFPVEISRMEKSALNSSLHQLGVQISENLRYKELADPSAEIFKESINKIEVSTEFQTHGPEVDPIWIYRAYQRFLENAVVNAYRQLTHGQVDSLFQSYGNHLFYRLYSILVIRGQIYIDYHQFAAILIRAGNLKKEQLYKYGYDQEFAASYKNIKDAFYFPKDLSRPPESITMQSPAKLTEVIRESAHKFANLVKSLNAVLRKSKNEEEIWIIKQIFRLHKEGTYDLWSAPSRKILDSSLYSERFWDMVRSIFEENDEFLEGVKSRVVIFLRPELQFLENFKMTENLEISDKAFEVVLECNLSKKDDQYDTFSEKINSILISWRTNKIYPPTIRDMEKISRIIQLHQIKWIELQQASGMYLAKEIVSQTVYREKEGPRLNLKALKGLDDSWKLMVGTPLRDPSQFPYPELLRKALDKNNYMTVAEFAGKVQELKDTVQELVYYTDFIKDLEDSFAEIPQVKNAPKGVRLLRKRLRDLELLFAKNLDDYEDKDLGDIETAASDILKLLYVTQKEETSVPMRYRFVNRALNSFNYKRKGNSVKELNKLIKSTADQSVTADGGSKSNTHKAFASQLEANIKFYNILNSKTFFFFFPLYNHVQYMKVALENLLYFKGISTNMYVDISSSESLFDPLLGYLPPQKLVNMKELISELPAD
jgi:hypothetical protein